MAPETHTDKVYEAELAQLRDRLLVMGGKVEAAIAGSVRALTERDPSLAEKVIAGDRDVNRTEVEIDDMCRRLLALRQPAASDLRFITTALKIVTDLERMGDLAVNVGRAGARPVPVAAVPPVPRPDRARRPVGHAARQGARRLRRAGRRRRPRRSSPTTTGSTPSTTGSSTTCSPT